MQGLEGIPKGLIVAAVLIVGVVVLILFKPPHRQCDSQIEMFRQVQKTRIFGSTDKAIPRSPQILRNIESCKMGNSPGACFELFSTLRHLMHDLQEMPLECADDLKNIGEVMGSLREGMSLLVQIAWGETPPERQVATVRMGWLESSDLALFCQIKDFYTRFFGKEELDQLRASIFSRLPGEAAVFSNGACVNCDYRKSAPQVLVPEEILARSLFALRCELYR